MRPSGAGLISTGQRPGDQKMNEAGALKGRHTGPAMSRPFRAHVSSYQPIQGRCPVLICGCTPGVPDHLAGIDAIVSRFRWILARKPNRISLPPGQMSGFRSRGQASGEAKRDTLRLFGARIAGRATSFMTPGSGYCQGQSNLQLLFGGMGTANDLR